MTLALVNGGAFFLVLAALILTIRRPIHGSEEGRAVLVLLGVLVLLSCVGLARRTGHPIADEAALAGWTAVAAVAVWLITRLDRPHPFGPRNRRAFRIPITKEHPMPEHLPPLDLSGQSDDGDQTALTQAHIEEIASVQEADPAPEQEPVDSILEEDQR